MHTLKRRARSVNALEDTNQNNNTHNSCANCLASASNHPSLHLNIILWTGHHPQSDLQQATPQIWPARHQSQRRTRLGSSISEAASASQALQVMCQSTIILITRVNSNSSRQPTAATTSLATHRRQRSPICCHAMSGGSCRFVCVHMPHRHMACVCPESAHTTHSSLLA